MLTDYEALISLILAETSITSLLGVFTGTTQPLVLVGTIPEAQDGLPAISLRNAIQSGDFGISDNFIECHCYASTEVESRKVAQSVYDYFRNSIGGVPGFGARFEASILSTQPDEKSTNTIVEIRVSYR